MAIYIDSLIADPDKLETYGELRIKFMQPHISIEYRTEIGLLKGWTFENIPSNAFGARIQQRYPIVNNGGNITFVSGTEFNYFVGKKTEVNKEEGLYIQDAFYKLNPNDIVFNSFEDMNKQSKEYTKPSK